MVDFKGLNDAVGVLETEIQTLTTELENVKNELERVKKEYHDESNPDTGMREFILEKAEKWKEQEGWESGRVLGKNEMDPLVAIGRSLAGEQVDLKKLLFEWKPAEEATAEIDKMSDIMKRKVDKKSVILFCQWKGSQLFFCDEKVVAINAGMENKSGEDKESIQYWKLQEAFSIDYKEIKDMDKIDQERNHEIKIYSSDKTIWRLGLNSLSKDVRDVLYTFLWDIYEFVNA